MAKKTYLRLNPHANSFTDPNTLFHLSGLQIKAVDQKTRASFHIKQALTSGHIKEVTEKEYKDYREYNSKSLKISETDKNSADYVKILQGKLADLKSENDQLVKTQGVLETKIKDQEAEIVELKNDSDEIIDLGKMNKEEIRVYMDENYELTDGDKKKMEGLNKDALLDFAKSIIEED